jgi:hypothetical protein
MMKFTELERQALGSIEHGLAGSDPRLASMLNIFSWLAAGEEMPAGEKIRVRRERPAARRPRRARRHPRRGRALPRPRCLYPRLGWQQAMLLLWVAISAGLLAVALILNTSGHKACIRKIGTSLIPAACQCVPLDEPAAPRGSLPAQTTGRLRNRSSGPISAHA